MSSLKTFLSDQETKTDLINNESIAKTIVTLLLERPDRPVTVGVHGDWGVGKSSILEMIETALETEKTAVCLKFNGWRFQGFEDAKIALLEGIVTELVARRPTSKKVKAKAKELFRQINWLKAARKTLGFAATAFTGIPTPEVAQTTIAAATQLLRSPTKVASQAEAVIKQLEGLFDPNVSPRNVPTEINEFRKSFEELLDEADVSQLVVLVDDLDRCLPTTAIETLEAIRLFVLIPKTAFVIAADEAMIEYSVRSHFPDLPTSSGPQSYARNYLEKLIQVPFRIPALGESETKIYVALALAEVNLGEKSAEFSKLLVHARDVLKRPWIGAQLADEKVADALGEKEAEAAELLTLSDQIGPILARGTMGNPRQIKRFLNALLLQERIAEARGFGEEVKLPILAKLLLASRFSPKFYDQIVTEASNDLNGKSNSLKSLEMPDEEVLSKPAGKTQKSSSEAEKIAEPNWDTDHWVQAWCELYPQLADVDLRPYAFVANQQERMNVGSALGHLESIVQPLLGSELSVAGMKSELEKMSSTDAKFVFTKLASRIRSGDLKHKPPGIEGIKVLVATHPALKDDLIVFLATLPHDSLGIWIVSGWNNVLHGKTTELARQMETWASSTNAALSRAAKTTQGVKK